MITIWTGPVNLEQVGHAGVEGSGEAAITCLGDGNPSCAQIASAWGAMGDPKVPTMLSALGLPADTPVALGAFSAGGTVVRRLCMNEADRHQIRAIYLADAIWTASWLDEDKRVPPYVEGLVRYGIDAANGKGVLVASSSPSPNKGWATGIENLHALRREIEARTGKRFRPYASPLTAKVKRASRLGKCYLLELPAKPLGHGHHVLASEVFPRIIDPALKPKSVAPLSGSKWAFAVAGIGLFLLLTKRRR